MGLSTRLTHIIIPTGKSLNQIGIVHVVLSLMMQSQQNVMLVSFVGQDKVCRLMLSPKMIKVRPLLKSLVLEIYRSAISMFSFWDITPCFIGSLKKKRLLSSEEDSSDSSSHDISRPAMTQTPQNMKRRNIIQSDSDDSPPASVPSRKLPRPQHPPSSNTQPKDETQDSVPLVVIKTETEKSSDHSNANGATDNNADIKKDHKDHQTERKCVIAILLNNQLCLKFVSVEIEFDHISPLKHALFILI